MSAARCRPTSSRRTRARTPVSSPPISRCGAWATSSSTSSTTRCGTSTQCRSPAPTSRRPGPTRSASWRSPSPTASPMSTPTSPAAWTSTISRPTCPSSSPTAWTLSIRSSAGWRGGSGRRRGRNGTARERADKLNYPVHTSGPSLHAQEMDFNDIRTTLPGLCAIYDNCNSLHTNAFDEAVTTPSEHSVRRALAIQMIIDKEWGLAGNENPLQGSYIIEQLTDLVEEAVLAEFDRLAERGGVLGAMETGYQRGRIQDESMLYEQRKHDGSLPIVGVNTFLPPHRDETPAGPVELARATEAEKESQLERLADFHARHAETAPEAIARLQSAAISGGNIFEALMDAVQHCSLGQISDAFFEAGGQYRRNV